MRYITVLYYILKQYSPVQKNIAEAKEYGGGHGAPLASPQNCHWTKPKKQSFKDKKLAIRCFVLTSAKENRDQMIIQKSRHYCFQLLEIGVTEQEWRQMKNSFFDFPILYIFNTRFFGKSLKRAHYQR